MTIDIKTAHIEPLRQTFDHVAARIGPGKAASRYQEAVHDVQMTSNFHYRPTWEPELELFDPRRTAIELADFDVLVDPRQYYYGPYTIQRAKQQEVQDSNFSVIEKRDLFSRMSPPWRERVTALVVPLRHFEWGANTNNCHISAYAYGTPFNSAALMQAMDRLGVAQYVTRLALAIEHSPAILDRGKALWLDDARWQPLRRLVEDAMVTRDWFELHVLQNLLLDGMIYSYAYQRFDEACGADGNLAFSLATEFMREFQAEAARWTDATVKVVVASSVANKARVEAWVDHWEPRVVAAVTPLAEAAFETEAGAFIAETTAAQAARRAKLGLSR